MQKCIWVLEEAEEINGEEIYQCLLTTQKLQLAEVHHPKNSGELEE